MRCHSCAPYRIAAHRSVAHRTVFYCAVQLPKAAILSRAGPAGTHGSSKPSELSVIIITVQRCGHVTSPSNTTGDGGMLVDTSGNQPQALYSLAAQAHSHGSFTPLRFNVRHRALFVHLPRNSRNSFLIVGINGTATYQSNSLEA